MSEFEITMIYAEGWGADIRVNFTGDYKMRDKCMTTKNHEHVQAAALDVISQLYVDQGIKVIEAKRDQLKLIGIAEGFGISSDTLLAHILKLIKESPYYDAQRTAQ